MNTHFMEAAKSVKALNKKASGLYGHIGAFVLEVAGKSPAGTDIKPLFKGAEAEAEQTLKIKMGENSTYRVVKNLFSNCVMKGIALVDEKGKLRGKTDLEAELDALKEPKTAMEKFQAAMTQATKNADKLAASERLTAAKLVSDLLEELSNQLRLAA